MGREARLYAEGRSSEKAFEETWKMYEERQLHPAPRKDVFAKAV
jgi:hypothetical protein